MCFDKLHLGSGLVLSWTSRSSDGRNAEIAVLVSSWAGQPSHWERHPLGLSMHELWGWRCQAHCWRSWRWHKRMDAGWMGTLDPFYLLCRYYHWRCSAEIYMIAGCARVSVYRLARQGISRVCDSFRLGVLVSCLGRHLLLVCSFVRCVFCKPVPLAIHTIALYVFLVRGHGGGCQACKNVIFRSVVGFEGANWCEKHSNAF